MKDRHFCIVEDKDRVRTVILNRPNVMNALHDDAHDELAEIWDQFSRDDDLWVGIVTGMGTRAFCAGNDLKQQATGLQRPLPATGFGGVTHRFDLKKPLIAAVNGLALGGGFEIVLAADIVIASEDAYFALPEPKVGAIAGGGGVHRLPRKVPYNVAMDIILSGRKLTPSEAFKLGLVNEVVKPEECIPAAKAFASRIISNSPMAIRAAKEAVQMGLDSLSLSEAIRTRYPADLENRQSEDFLEGPRAFSEKRTPVWKNR